jgi:hypothetical protein
MFLLAVENIISSRPVALFATASLQWFDQLVFIDYIELILLVSLRTKRDQNESQP